MTKIEFGLTHHTNLQLTKGTLNQPNWLYEYKTHSSPRSLHMRRQSLGMGATPCDCQPIPQGQWSDSDDDVMLGSTFGNSRSEEAILFVFLSESEENSFSSFLIEDD